MGLLSLTVFSLNVFNLPQEIPYTLAEKHFKEDIQVQKK